jgi:methionine sulfoxide reductase catalytic subunit
VAHPGLPIWVGVQHFFNLFLLIFIIRSGVQILSDHPRLYWTRHSTPGKDWFRIQKPVPADPLWTAKQDSISLRGQVGLPGIRHSIRLARWWHLGVNTLWLLNGAVFYVLPFTTGQWRHVVPTSWWCFRNSVSVLTQYLSLNWPTEKGADDTRIRCPSSRPSTPKSNSLWCRLQRARPLSGSSGPSKANHRTCAASIPTVAPAS